MSVSTIKRRLQEFNISIRATLTDISDADLDALCETCKQIFQMLGTDECSPNLTCLVSVKVSQSRVRESTQRTDPDGVAIYCVSGPLALWHIDGKHKLIR